MTLSGPPRPLSKRTPPSLVGRRSWNILGERNGGGPVARPGFGDRGVDGEPGEQSHDARDAVCFSAGTALRSDLSVAVLRRSPESACTARCAPWLAIREAG